jgi:hypothetical protein
VAQELFQGTYVHYVLTLALSQGHLLSLSIRLFVHLFALCLFVSFYLPNSRSVFLFLSLSHIHTHIHYLYLSPSPLPPLSHTLTHPPPSSSLSLQCGDDESVWGCNRHLTLDSYVAYGGWPFCKPCYTKNFKQGTTYLSAVWCDAVLYWSVLYCTAYFS